MHVQLPCGMRGLNLCLSFHLHSYFVCSESRGEWQQMNMQAQLSLGQDEDSLLADELPKLTIIHQEKLTVIH